jgi:hypothetical protein
MSDYPQYPAPEKLTDQDLSPILDSQFWMKPWLSISHCHQLMEKQLPALM